MIEGTYCCLITNILMELRLKFTPAFLETLEGD